MNVIYKAAAAQKTYKSNRQFYQVVKFWSKTVSDNYYLNEPQKTRGKALAIARNYISNLKD